MPGQKLSTQNMVRAILILVVVTGIFAFLNTRGEKPEEGKIRIKAGNHLIREITVDEVKKLPVVKKKLVINSTTGLTKHEFTGTPLREVFNYIDPEIINRYQRVITKGVDNYTSGVNMEEVREKNNVVLVYADRGVPLKSKNGKTETMRIVILNDQFGQRFTNFLVELNLEK